MNNKTKPHIVAARIIKIWRKAAEAAIAERIQLAQAAGIPPDRYFVFTGNHDLPRAPDGLTQDETNVFDKEVLATWKQLHEKAGLTLLTTRPDEIWRGNLPVLGAYGRTQLLHYVANGGPALQKLGEGHNDSVQKKIENGFKKVPQGIGFQMGADLHMKNPALIVGPHWYPANGINYLRTLQISALEDWKCFMADGNGNFEPVDLSDKKTPLEVMKGTDAPFSFNNIHKNPKDPFHTFQVTTQKLERGEEDQSRIAA